MTDKHFLGVDTGGTFTDFYWRSPTGSRIHKVLSTPQAPERAILQGIDELGLTAVMNAGDLVIVHGSTVATNAALEGKGARTVFVTNKGFKDLLALARQNREAIYALHPEPVSIPVPEHLCLEVDCRRDASGRVVMPLTQTAIADLHEQLQGLHPESVAINLLYAFLNAEDEKQLLTAVPDGVMACYSADVLPEYREYERGVATWLNAWLGPKVAHYLECLQQHVSPSPLAVMQSSGGTMAADQAGRRAVNLLLSGPAGGLAAAHHIGEQIGVPRLLTFDMGGTSTDVAMIDGKLRLTTESWLGHYPVAVPMIDMHTIGAGGGSIAYLDQAGLLHVGPESAGAVPGPACYGLGGQQATVTDANLVLGRLRADHFLGGRMMLDINAALCAVGKLATAMAVDVETAALGVIALANEHMARALRVISVQRGYNPRLFELCCFGGAGGLHVCSLAEELGVARILVPANGGVLSAFGMLVAQPQRQLSRTLLLLLDDLDVTLVERHIKELGDKGKAELIGEGVTAPMSENASLDCRYAGQSFTLNIPWIDGLDELAEAFHAAHKTRYGHSLALPLEIVNVRVQIQAPRTQGIHGNAQVPLEITEPRARVDLPKLGITDVWLRAEIALGQQIAGPAIICEPVATTLLAEHWIGSVDQWGNLRLVDKRQV